MDTVKFGFLVKQMNLFVNCISFTVVTEMKLTTDVILNIVFLGPAVELVSKGAKSCWLK